MYTAPTSWAIAIDTAGATALEMAVVIAKYPMPSAKRCLGMMSAAMVEDDVDPKPQPMPWITRKPRMTPTMGKMANDNMEHAMIASPPMSMPLRPNLSSSAPENTRMTVAAIVMTVVASPTSWPVAPSWSMYTGRPTLSIWKPKNMHRLIVAKMTKSRVKTSPSDERCRPLSAMMLQPVRCQRGNAKSALKRAFPC